MNKIFLCTLFIIAFFLRFYQLGIVPAGLTNDEASLGYDAYSLLTTGRDQWDVFLPLSFKEFGDYKLPIYMYLLLAPIKFFGLNEFSTRIPSATFGVFSTITIYFLIKKLFDNKIAFISSILFAISPWSIGLSRAAMEPNIAITFILLGLFFFLHGQKNTKFLYLSVIFFVLTFYTYSAYTLFSPLVLFLLFYFYRNYFFSHKKETIISLLLFILLLTPFFIGNKITANVRFSQVGFINSIDIIGLTADLNDQRGSCLNTYPPFICRITNNKLTLYLSKFTQNYLSHFSFNFLYTDGTSTQYSILPKRGLGFTFEVIFLILGFAWVFLKNKQGSKVILVILLLAPIPDALTGTGHHARASTMLPFLIIVEAMGFNFLLENINKIKVKIVKWIFLASGSLIITYSFLAFFISYFNYFRHAYSLYSQYGYRELMEDVYNQRNIYDKIYISNYINDSKQYIYYLFYNKYDPNLFQKKVNVSFSQRPDGWISIDKIDNVYFVTILPLSSYKNAIVKEKILLIAHPKAFPQDLTPKNIIKDKQNNIIFKEIDLKDLINYWNSNKSLFDIDNKVD